MRKIFLSIILIQVSLISYSQINFENGYIYDNENNKTVCLIKNIDWLNNPTKIEYKLNENSEVKSATINTISEFGVSGTVFKRFTVQIDRSGQEFKNLSITRALEFKKETLFLRQIIKGDYNLFSYTDGNYSTYFLNSNDKDVAQLVYKRYFKEENMIAENNMFRQQLLTKLKCNNISLKDIESLKYSIIDLKKLFLKYNSCKGIIYDNKEKLDKKDLFDINIRAGMTVNSFKIPIRGFTNPSSYEFDFGRILGYQLGVEAEYILPFNKNKWSIMIEPTYNHFESETTSNNSIPEEVALRYNTFELPAGIRHYFFLNDDTSKLFINVSYVLIFDLNSEFTTRNGFAFEKGTNQSYGIGYKYAKYSIEVRYDTDRGRFSPRNYIFDPEYTSFSIILGFNIL